jgi:hypothetical protein
MYLLCAPFSTIALKTGRLRPVFNAIFFIFAF